MRALIQNAIQRAISYIGSTQREDGSWDQGLNPLYGVTATSLALCAHSDMDQQRRKAGEAFLRRTLSSNDALHMPRLFAWPLWGVTNADDWSMYADHLIRLQEPEGAWRHAKEETVRAFRSDVYKGVSLLPTFLAIHGLMQGRAPARDKDRRALDLARIWLENLAGRPRPDSADETTAYPVCATAFSLLGLIETESQAIGAASRDSLADSLASFAHSGFVSIEAVPNAGRMLDTPYTLFTPAWALLALATYQRATDARIVASLVRTLLDLQQGASGAVCRTREGGDADIYSTAQFVLALRAAERYLNSDAPIKNLLLDDSQSRNSCDVIVLCALQDPEFIAVQRFAPDGVVWTQRPVDDSHVYWSAKIQTESGQILSLIAGCPSIPGPTAMAILTTKMILRFRPKLAVMLGIAAGVKSKTRDYGDILVGREAFDYGSGKLTEKDGQTELIPDPQPITIDTTLTTLLRSLGGKYANDIYEEWTGERTRGPLRVHVGPIASGSAVVTSSRIVSKVQAVWRKLIGVEMEVYAMYRAAHEALPKPPLFVAIKGVCDYANPKKNDKWQEFAAYTSASFFYKALSGSLGAVVAQRR